MEIAAKRINNAGGVLGRPIKVVFDDQSAAPDVLVQDIARDKMFAAAGFDSSDPAIRVIPEIMKQKMILMVTGAGSPQITELCSFRKVYRERQAPLPLYDIAANRVELEDQGEGRTGR